MTEAEEPKFLDLELLQGQLPDIDLAALAKEHGWEEATWRIKGHWGPPTPADNFSEN